MKSSLVLRIAVIGEILAGEALAMCVKVDTLKQAAWLAKRSMSRAFGIGIGTRKGTGKFVHADPPQSPSRRNFFSCMYSTTPPLLL